MKLKIIFVIYIGILSSVFCMGQQQECFIHMAQGKDPLEGVYVTPIGNYNGDRSDENGRIKLYFPDKRNGDPFRIKSIEKKDYVLTDNDKHWLRHDVSLSSNVRLDIAMKSESQVRRESANWSHSITSAANERWYNKEKSLNDSLDMQRITIQEYEKEIEALKRAKESFGQMISYMSEYCASIDLSKITANQQKVLNLLKEGDIESANTILDIDSIGDDEIMANLVKTKKEISSIRQKADSLSNAVRQAEKMLRNQMDAAKTNFCLKAQISYQKGDFRQAAYYFSKAADIEESDVDRQIEAACSYLLYEENDELFQKYLTKAKNNILTKEDAYKYLEVLYLYNFIHGKLITAGQNAVSMITLYINPLDYVDFVTIKIADDDNEESTVETAIAKDKSSTFDIESIYTANNNAYKNLSHEISELKCVDFRGLTLPNAKDSINCSMALSYLGLVCQSIGRGEDAVIFILESQTLYPVNDDNYEFFITQFIGCLSTLLSNGFYREALDLCNSAAIPLAGSYTEEQESWNSILDMYAAICRSKIGQLNNNESERFNKGLDAYAKLISPKNLSFLLLKSGIIPIYIAEGSYKKGVETADSILNQIKHTIGKVPPYYDYLISNCKATCLYYMSEYKNALNIFLRLRDLLESEESKDEFAGDNNTILKSLNLYNIAQNYIELNDIDKACSLHERALALRKNLYGDSHSNWLYESYRSLIPAYVKLNGYDRAKELVDEYISCSKTDTLQNWNALTLKYDVLISQLKNSGLSKQIEQEFNEFFKINELAFWNTRNDTLYIFLDYDKYDGFPNDLRESIVLTPSNDVCKLKDAANFISGRCVIIPSSPNDIKEHTKIYKQWSKKLQK